MTRLGKGWDEWVAAYHAPSDAPADDNAAVDPPVDHREPWLSRAPAPMRIVGTALPLGWIVVAIVHLLDELGALALTGIVKEVAYAGVALGWIWLGTFAVREIWRDQRRRLRAL